jgi:hypothetical protein
MTRVVDDLRAELRRPDHDPAALHDRLRVVIDDMASHGEAVPVDLREAVTELEAEILDAFHDNLPV